MRLTERYQQNKIILLLLWTAMCLILLSGCRGEEPKPSTVTVVVENRQEFSTEQTVVSVPKGDDVVISCIFEPGFTFLSCNYHDYTVNVTEDGITKLTLHAVRYPLRLKIEAGASETSVCYYANGGKFLDGNGEYRLIPAETESHKRVNTSIGTDLLKRDGCTQTGWNTEPDGSGEHIGLGSRVTPVKNGIVSLYAEWSKWTSPADFTYEENATGVTITGYRGEMPAVEFSIPAYLNGKPVNRIAAGAIQQCDAPRLILPHTLNIIEESAFSGGRIEEIFFYDTLVTVKDASFPNSIPTVHINAILSPRYLNSNTNVQFAENLDSLMLSSGKKKLIFFGGCSMCFGLRSDLIEEAFPEYLILDMGVIGSTPASVQLECISHFVESGDVFVHAPEERSRYQLMDSMEGEPRMFLMLEGNYDLLALCDVSGIEHFFEAFCDFNTGRAALPACSYNDHLTCYNEYGDYIVERPMQEEDVNWHTNDIYDLSFVNEQSVEALCHYYGLFREKGATVLFSFAPHNYQSLSGSCTNGKTWNAYEARLREELGINGYRVISHAEDYIYSGRYFHDTDYHLNDVGAVMRTKQLIRDLQNYFSTM